LIKNLKFYFFSLDDNNERFPQSLSTALFSFLYHLASYETGGDALVNCGIMQSLIKVVNYYDESQDFIMVKKTRMKKFSK
jgi:E3 ubiquitin-protein ligase HUWE1